MLHARPNLNGDLPGTFEDTGYDLFSSSQKIRAALIEVRAVLHLRNYQTTDPELRPLDVARLEGYIAATFAMEELAMDLIRAGKAE